MAITNAQQYKQLVNKPADNKRPGYRGDAAYGKTSGSEQAKSFSKATSRDSKPTKNDYQGSKGPSLGDGKASGTTVRYDPQKALDRATKVALEKPKGFLNRIPSTIGIARKGINRLMKNQLEKNRIDYIKRNFPQYYDQEVGELVNLPAYLQGLVDDDKLYTDQGLKMIQNLGKAEGVESFEDFMFNVKGSPGLKFAGNVGGLGTRSAVRDADGNIIGYKFDNVDEFGNIIGTRGEGEGSNLLPPVIAQAPSITEQESEYVNPLSLLSPRIAGTRFLGTELEDEEDTEFAANGGRIGFGGGSDMGTVADSKGSVGPSKGGYQGGGTGPVERPGGGGNGGPKTTPTNVGGGGGGVTTLKTKKDIRTPSDFTKFDLKDLVNLYQDEEEDNMLMAGLNQPQVDYLNKVGGKVYNVDKTGDFFNYDSPTNIKKQIEKLNPESENIFGTFKPSKIVEGDPSTYATEKDVQDYIKSQFPTLRTDGREIGLAGGGIASLDREAFIFGGIAKGLKKAIRGVKKLAKSPIGKAALAFGAYKLGSGFLKNKGIMSSLFGEYGGTSRMTDGLLGKLGITGGGGSKALTGLGKGVLYAGVPAAIAALTTPEEDDKFDIDAYYAANRLNSDTPLNKRILGTEFYAAEGGMPSKEPVAKKTMPLLDMDGQEMDLREEGGFVPLGRMERADDVPARLSKNEFVFTADAVRNAGEGDIDKGAEVMYNMMKNLESGGEVSEESQGLDGAREMFQTSKRLEEVL